MFFDVVFRFGRIGNASHDLFAIPARLLVGVPGVRAIFDPGTAEGFRLSRQPGVTAKFRPTGILVFVSH